PSASDTQDGALTPAGTRSPGSTFPLGTTIVTYTATDAGGLTTAASFTVTVRDTTAPTFSNIPADMATEATGPSGAVVSWTAPTARDLVDPGPTVTSDHNPGETFPLGTTTVTYTARDAAGNEGTASFTITVRDTMAPNFSNVPGNIIVEATGPSGAVVSWTPPTVSDLVSASPTVTSNHSPGETFAVGTSTVSYTATDAAGNQSQASFTVTVRDTTAPSFSNVPGSQTLEATGPSGAVATWTPPTASDTVDASVTITSDHSPGDTFAVGTTSVIYIATDDAGNHAKHSFDIDVQDTTRPTFSNVPGNQTLEATGPAGAIATWAPPTASDTVDTSVTVSSNHSPGETFPLGTTTVTYTARDDAGNEA